jgi:CheY-like chemotaxis protein
VNTTTSGTGPIATCGAPVKRLAAPGTCPLAVCCRVQLVEWASALLPAACRRILAVDANVDTADSLAMLLTLGGHEVCTAHDGPAGDEQVYAFRPDVVLLDLGMPGVDGYETARRMRASEAGRRAVLVAPTGWGQEEDRRRMREAGFDHHLVKPVDLAALKGRRAGLGQAR